MKRISPESKVLEMPLRVAGVPPNLSIEQGNRPLCAALSGLRSEFNGLSIRLAREYGVKSAVVSRAEQIAGAVQRLEWALEREESDPSAS